MRRTRRQHSRGFTLVELMVVVAIVGVVAAIAVPRLGGKGRSARDTDSFSRAIVANFDRLRIRAMSERRSMRSTITRTSFTVESRDLATNAWVVEATTVGPNEAMVWDVSNTGVAPTTIMLAATTHTVQFNSDFSITVDGVSPGNANIYVGGITMPVTGAHYQISVIPTGAINRLDVW